MASLQDQQIRQLHKSFVKRSDRFPELRFIAATRSGSPATPADSRRQTEAPQGRGEKSDRLTKEEWEEVLGRQNCGLLGPLKKFWLRFEDRIWEGAFYDNAEYRSDETLLKQFERLKKGIKEFRQLATEAWMMFATEPRPSPVDPPLRDDDADRWLEIVCQSPSDTKDRRHSRNIRSRGIRGNVFMASARVIDSLRKKRQDEGKGKAGSAPVGKTRKKRSRKGIGGPKPIAGEEAEERLDILERWMRAKEAGVRQKDFCRDRGLDPDDLQRYLRWHFMKRFRKRRR